MGIRLAGLAITLVALLASTSSTASAATFSGGTLDLNFKQLTQKGVQTTFNNAASSSKRAATFAIGDGTATLDPKSSGQLDVGGTNRSITLTKGGRRLDLTNLVEELAAGRGRLTAKIGASTVAMFDQVSAGKVEPSADFGLLAMTSSELRFTKAGAAAVNKAFGLRKPQNGEPDRRFKAKQKVGSAKFSATRSLNIVGGVSRTIYDVEFFDKLKNDCDITQSAGAGSTPIEVSGSAPRGGVDLPVVRGVLSGADLRGSIFHDGGTRLDRPVGSPKGPEYHSRLTQFAFATTSDPPVVEAFSSELFGRLRIGGLNGAQVATTLTATGGIMTIQNATLALSDAAVSALRTLTGCDLATGSRIGAVTTFAGVV